MRAVRVLPFRAAGAGFASTSELGCVFVLVLKLGPGETQRSKGAMRMDDDVAPMLHRGQQRKAAWAQLSLHSGV